MAREHRLSARVPLELPVHVWWTTTTGKSQEVEGKTGNISANGMFVTIRRRLRQNAPISFRVDLPPEITRAPVQLLGHGRIVRRSGAGEAPGIAAVIDEYDIRPAGH
ncbi:MAG: PilZ domain-containing protein [Terriglobia bacterium]